MSSAAGSRKATPRVSASGLPSARSIQGGDRRALSRLMTAVESGEPGAREILRQLYPSTGKATIVGLTGPLGVGKSSLVNRLLQHLRSQGKKVGIVAVDPSSPFTGGAVLGDRIRVERQVGDAGVFFRSMASRGASGGVAQTTRDIIRLLEAFGMDVVLVETVGSGQVDVEIRNLATTSLVVLVPHLGDEVQSLKAGLFEIADIFVVNKCDLPGSDTAVRYLRELVAVTPPRDGWVPDVVATSAQAGTGLEDLWRAVEAHEKSVRSQDADGAVRQKRLTLEIEELMQTQLAGRLHEAIAHDPALQALVRRVVEQSLDPYTAADEALEIFRRR